MTAGDRFRRHQLRTDHDLQATESHRLRAESQRSVPSSSTPLHFIQAAIRFLSDLVSRVALGLIGQIRGSIRHLRGLLMSVTNIVEPEALPDGAAQVETIYFALVHRFCDEILDHHGILKIWGKPGRGKTRAVDDYCKTTDAELVVKLHLASKARGNAILRELCEGLHESTAGDGLALIETATEALWGRRVLIYIDEADQSNRDGLRHLRFIYDARDVKNLALGLPPRKMLFGIVLVGNDFHLNERLAPELFSRVTRRVEFKPLEGKALLDALRVYHPLFAGADETLLKTIDREQCKGEWRAWRLLLETYVEYAGRIGVTTLVRDVVAQALGAIGNDRRPSRRQKRR